MNIRILQREVTAQRGIKIKIAPMRYKFMIAWGKYQGSWQMDAQSTKWRKNQINKDMYQPISGAENCKYIRKGVRHELVHIRPNPLKVALVRQFQSQIPAWALKAIRRKSGIDPHVVNCLQELSPEFLARKKLELHSLRYFLTELGIDTRRLRYLTENMTKMEFRKIFRGFKNEAIKYIHWYMHSTTEERMNARISVVNPDRMLNAELSLEINGQMHPSKYLPELRRIRTTINDPNPRYEMQLADQMLHEIAAMAKQLTKLGHKSNWRSTAKTWSSLERFRQYHQEQIATFKLLKAEGSNIKYNQLEIAPPNCTQLLTEAELLVEGMELNHCVGGYHDRCSSGHSVIFKVEMPEFRGTLELGKETDWDGLAGSPRYWKVRQVHGRNNCDASYTIHHSLAAWVESNQEYLVAFKAGTPKPERTTK